MLWKDYHKSYQGFWGAQASIRLLCYSNQIIVNDLPDSLPERIKGLIAENTLNNESIVDEIFAARKENRVFERTIPLAGRDEYERLFIESLIYLGVNMWERLMRDYLPWEDMKMDPLTVMKNVIATEAGRLVNSQALVMLFAYLDAFISDSLRTACQAHPEILRRSEKQVPWITVLEYNDIRELHRYLMETLVLEMGFPSYQKRFRNIKKLLGLKFDFDKAILDELDAAEHIRNITLHNGGKASPEFLERTKRKDVAVGEPVPVTMKDIEAVVAGSTYLVQTLFEAISTKFCGVSAEQLRKNYSIQPIP